MFLKKQSITKGAIILGIASFLSYLLGLVRDRLLASSFGAGNELDAYNSAFLVPDIIANLLFAGVSLAVLMPVLTDILTREKEEDAFQLANTVVNLAALILLVLSTIAFIFMPVLIRIVAPGFDEEQQMLSMNLSRLMLLSPMLFALSNALGSILVSMKRFVGYAFSPVFYNVGIVCGLLLFADQFGIYAAAIGTLIGAFLHLSIRIVELIRTPFQYRPILLFSHPALRKIGALMVPKMIGLLAWQVNLWAWTAIASTLTAGSIAIFSFSRNLQSLPVSLFGIALATAVYPTLAEKFAQKDWGAFTENIRQTFSRIFFFVLPASVGIFLLRTEIVRSLLGVGDFTEADVQKTAFALGMFCIVIPFESMVHLFVRAFYAQLDTKTPVIVALVMTAVNITSGYVLTQAIGVAGLPLGFAAASMVQTGLLLILLRRRIPALKISTIKNAAGQAILASSIMAGVMAILLFWLRSAFTSTTLNDIITMSVAILIGGITYLLAGFVLKNENMAVVRRLLPGR